MFAEQQDGEGDGQPGLRHIGAPGEAVLARRAETDEAEEAAVSASVEGWQEFADEQILDAGDLFVT